ARPAVIFGVDGGALVLRVDRLISPHHHTIKIGWLKTLPVLVFVFGLGTLFTSRYMLRSPLPTPAATQFIPHIMSHPLISQMRIAPPTTKAEPAISQPIILKTHVAPTRIAKLALQPVTKLINMQIATISSPPALPGYRPANTEMAHPPSPATKPMTTASNTSTGNTASAMAPAMALQYAATAPVKIISVHHLQNDPIPPKSKENHWYHDYCQPLVGSRICR
ncbi:MAG: hypothetical protein KGJ56_05320, partial [Gammaproteobacteria bacterium]|nr:hypothetical protein [Gammaproteobacteria bacterium]